MSPSVFATVIQFLYTGYAIAAFSTTALCSPYLYRRASITHESALDVLIAADMLRLPRLVQLSEIALQAVRFVASPCLLQGCH